MVSNYGGPLTLINAGDLSFKASWTSELRPSPRKGLHLYDPRQWSVMVKVRGTKDWIKATLLGRLPHRPEVLRTLPKPPACLWLALEWERMELPGGEICVLLPSPFIGKRFTENYPNHRWRSLDHGIKNYDCKPKLFSWRNHDNKKYATVWKEQILVLLSTLKVVNFRCQRNGSYIWVNHVVNPCMNI